MRRLALACTLVATAGCYSARPIPLASLDELSAAPGRPLRAEIAGEGCDGCRVEVDPTTPLLLTTTEGEVHRVTPFYFHVNAAQLVAPDYGVLVDRRALQKAEVRSLSVGGTLLLAGLVVAAAAGTFLAIQLTAGNEDLRAR